jgi:hypothetical protein
MKTWITAAAVLLIAPMAMAQDVIIHDPNVTAGEVRADSGSLATNAINFEGSRQTDRLETTPNVQPPSLVGGNPCAIGASLGGSIVGFGISGAVMKEGDRCELRQSVALLANMGFVNESLVMFCMGNKEVATTFAALGMNCEQLAGVVPNQLRPVSLHGPAMPETEVIVSDAAGIVTKSRAGSCDDASYATAMTSSWDDVGSACRSRHLAVRAGADR